MKFDIKILEKYYEDGLLLKQTHPFYPLTIWNYSQDVQYNDLWDDVLIHCRGLITETNGDVVAKPFKKFFNIEENKHKHSNEFTIWEKVDGSLGILFWYANDWHICSRGSFTSDQAVKAKEMLDKIPDGWKYYLNKGYTFLFEIVYPENRIVLDYKDREALILIGAVNTDTGMEMTPDECMVCNDWFESAMSYGFPSIDELKKLAWENHEGFVVHYNSGDKVKIKFKWYLERHKVVWTLTNTLIWEYLSEGRESELFEMVPDEYYETIKKEISLLTKKFKHFSCTYQDIYYLMKDKVNNRKEFAAMALREKHSQILFKMYSNENPDASIWKLVKPERTIKLLTK